MTRDETVALFLECEAKRAEARAAALAEGKDKHGADTAAHEAAKAHWNAWAEPLLAERKAMEADGRWAAEKDWMGDLEPKNAKTHGWMDKAEADLPPLSISCTGGAGNQKRQREKSKKRTATANRPSNQSSLRETRADFSGFIFPGNARFESATFSDYAWFESATFSGSAWFDSASFSGGVSFASATFSGYAWFASATFSGSARLEGATFSGYALFAGTTFSGTTSFDSVGFSSERLVR